MKTFSYFLMMSFLLSACSSEALESNDEALTEDSTETEEETAVNTDDCNDDWVLFEEENFQFCYKEAWGTPDYHETSVSESARIGSIWYVSFSEANTPLLYHSTLDYAKTGDGDVGYANYWPELDLNLSEEELADVLEGFETQLEPDIAVEKVEVDDYEGLKMDQDIFEPLSQERVHTVQYLIPAVEMGGETYNFTAMIDASAEADLDVMMESFQFME